MQKFEPCDLAMRACSNCERSGRISLCKLSDRSDKCLECVRLEYSCDLAPFDPVKWRRLKATRKRLRQEASDALAKFTRLQRQIEFLKDQKREMMKSKLKNIEELEQQEHSSSAMLNDFASSVFLMNVEFEQLEISSDFD